MTPGNQYPYPLPLKNPVFENQGTASNQINLGDMTHAWMGVFQGIVALCLTTVIFETLSESYNVVPPAAANGQLLGVILIQNSTGGNTVTWDAQSGEATTILFPPAANALPNGVTVALFLGAGGYWWGLPYPAAGGGGGSGSVVYSLDDSVSAAYNVSTTAPAWVAGALLTVRLLQDATGGWAVTWGADFKYAPVLPTAANLESLCTFFGASSGVWELCAAPILGRPT